MDESECGGARRRHESGSDLVAWVRNVARVLVTSVGKKIQIKRLALVAFVFQRVFRCPDVLFRFAKVLKPGW